MKKRSFIPYPPRHYYLAAAEASAGAVASPRHGYKRLLFVAGLAAVTLVGILQSGYGNLFSRSGLSSGGVGELVADDTMHEVNYHEVDPEIIPVERGIESNRAKQSDGQRRHSRVEALKRRKRATKAASLKREQPPAGSQIDEPHHPSNELANEKPDDHVAVPTQEEEEGLGQPVVAQQAEKQQQEGEQAVPAISGATVFKAEGADAEPQPPRGLIPSIISTGNPLAALQLSASGWTEPAYLGLARAASAITERDAVKCNMPTGVAGAYNLPPNAWKAEFDASGSEGHLIYNANGHMEDEYLFHSVKLVGRTLQVHKLRYYEDGKLAADSSRMPLRSGHPGGDLDIGLRLKESEQPLDCRNGVNGDDWFVMIASSTENVFHQLNDNLLPYWQAVQQMRAARLRSGASPSSSEKQPRSILYLAKTLTSWGAPSGSFWGYALQTGFDEQVNEGSYEVAGGVCIKNLRIGRPRKMFWASFQSLMNYQSLNVVRSWADHLVARSGLAYPSSPPSWPPKARIIRRDGGVRRFEDTELLQQAFSEVGINLEAVSLEALQPRQQLELLTQTDILIGVHGAGLALGIYMRPGSLLVQLGPTNLNYWETTLFHRMNTLAGVGYYDWAEHDPHHERAGGGGWSKGSVKFRHEEEWNGIKWCEDTRVFVAQTAMVWIREAERAHALRLALGSSAATS